MFPFINRYHLVDGSPWPLLISLALFAFAVTLVAWLAGYQLGFLSLLPFFLILLILFQWWRDVLRESKGGFHTTAVQKGLMIGFLLFLLSEIMLFFSFFWAYGHASLSPSLELGSQWPPLGLLPLDSWSLPLLGTSLLLSSGFLLTLGHEAFLSGNKSGALLGFFFSILIGALFLFVQYSEYNYSPYTIADSVFGSTFFLLTGLHGLHVIVGVIMLIVSFLRIYFDDVTTSHASGVDFSIYYWHFVDVIWLF